MTWKQIARYLAISIGQEREKLQWKGQPVDPAINGPPLHRIIRGTRDPGAAL